MLYAIDARLPFYLSTIPLGLSAAAVFFLHEDFHPGIVEGAARRPGVLTSIRRAIMGNAEYRACLIEFAVVTALLQCGLWFYQPFFQRCGVGEVWFGFIFAAFNLVAAAASHLAPRLEKAGRLGRPVITQLLVACAGYALMTVSSWTWGFSFIFLHQIVRGWLGVSMRERSQNAGRNRRGALTYFFPGVGWTSVP